MNGPQGPLRSTISLPQLSQNSFSGTSSAPGAERSGLAAKFSFVKSQLTCSTVIFLAARCAFSIAADISFTSFTSCENSVTSSIIPFTVIGNCMSEVIFFTTLFWSFFQGPAGTVIGLVLVKLEQE